MKRRRKKWIVDAVKDFQADANTKDGVDFAVLLKDALERPSEYILTHDQCKALLSLIAVGKKHLVSKTTNEGEVMDVALRPSLFLRLKALEALYTETVEMQPSLPITIEVMPVASLSDAQKLQQIEQSEQAKKVM